MKRIKKGKRMIGITVIVLFLFVGTVITSLTQEINYQIKDIDNTKELEITISAASDPDIQIIWNNIWDGERTNTGLSVWSDGTYIYTTGRVYNGADHDLVLIKWDANGNILWNYTWDSGDSNAGYSVWGDGTYLYTTGEAYNEICGRDLVLIKWDTNGNILWNHTWDSGGSNIGYSVWGDGTYLYVTGNTYNPSTNRFGLTLMQWDSNGNIIWDQTLDSGDYDFMGCSVWGDGTYLYTTGKAYNVSEIYNHLLLVKWDLSGNVLWNYTWDSGYFSSGLSVWGDGTYLYVTGQVRDMLITWSDLVLIKWDLSGNILWNYTWGGIDGNTGYSVWGDGTYLYTTGVAWNGTSNDLVLIKWDTDGNVLWNYAQDSGDFSSGRSVGRSVWGDGTYLYTTGRTYNETSGSDLYLAKWSLPGSEDETENGDITENETEKILLISISTGIAILAVAGIIIFLKRRK